MLRSPVKPITPKKMELDPSLDFSLILLGKGASIMYIFIYMNIYMYIIYILYTYMYIIYIIYVYNIYMYIIYICI